MSTTPRTDLHVYGSEWEQVVSADFARQLERELAEAKAVVADVTDGRTVYLQHEIDDVAQRAISAEDENTILQSDLAALRRD